MVILYNNSYQKVNNNCDLINNNNCFNFPVMDTLAKRLRQAREEKGLTQKELADRAGVSQVTINYVESGRNKSTGRIVDIARALEVDPIWLASGYQKPIQTPTSKGPSGQTKQPSIEDATKKEIEEALEMRHNYVLVPRYDVAAAMGHGAAVHSEQIVDHLAFQREWVEKDLELKPEDLVLIKSRGDSMMPTIHPGELLLVDTSTQEVHDGLIYVLSFDGDLLAKRIQKTPTGGIVITSDNQKYESFTVPHDEAANLRIIGRVVWAGRRM